MGSYILVFDEAVIFALYIFICLTLLKPRFSLGVRVSIYGAVLLCSVSAVTALSLSGYFMAALTLLPLIAYLPFSVCAYILSKSGIFETATACSVGALSAFIIKTVNKELKALHGAGILHSGTVADVLNMAVVLVLAAAAAYVVLRFIRKTFSVCAGSDMKNRLLVLVPTVTMLMLLLFNFNSTTTIAFSIMTLVLAVSFFVITARLFVYNAKIIETKDKEKSLSESLELQRKSFERLSQSVDSGRRYRHDMRHHLKILAGMAQQDNSVEIIKYIEELNETTELCAPEMFCKNPAVNAVLSEYISRAENIGCRTEHRIFIPEEFPFELPDVCIILSNALENALNACGKCPEDKRYIELMADFSDDCKLKISVRNPCADIVEIGTEGLPVVAARTDGHGIGLRGVKMTVEKYNGFICCEYENGEFVFFAEIFRDPNNRRQSGKKAERAPKHSKALPAVLTSLVCAVGLVNFSPAAASALSEVLSVDVKTISYGWGENGLNIRYPVFSGDGSDTLNQASNDFIAEARDTFMNYTLRKYEGYVAEDAGYRIHMNDRYYLSARFYATVNLGGSMEYSRCVTINKQSGEVLALSDLFDEGYDYIGEISAEVLRQMEFRTENEGASYFIPGGIWSDEECFKEISPDQDFYLTSDGLLVIVFEEYTVAPGSEGSPEFVMPYEIFLLDMH